MIQITFPPFCAKSVHPSVNLPAEEETKEEAKEDSDASNEALLGGIGITRSNRCMSSTNGPKFHESLSYPKQAQQSLFSQSLQGLQDKISKAIRTLDRNMDSEDAPTSTQVRAAQIVIEQSVSIYKMSELEAKIAELERVMKQQPEQGVP